MRIHQLSVIASRLEQQSNDIVAKFMVGDNYVDLLDLADSLNEIAMGFREVKEILEEVCDGEK